MKNSPNTNAHFKPVSEDFSDPYQNNELGLQFFASSETIAYFTYIKELGS